MNKVAAVLLLAGALMLAAAVAAWDWRAGLGVAGVMSLATGVLSLDRPEKKPAEAARR